MNLQHCIRRIDLSAVNPYSFRRVTMSGGSFDECIETIDIGGPVMLRNSA